MLLSHLHAVLRWICIVGLTEKCSINITYSYFVKFALKWPLLLHGPLSRLCFKCYIYLKYILDSVSEYNGYYMARRWHRKECLSISVVILPQIDLLPNSETFSDLASTLIGFTTHVVT